MKKIDIPTTASESQDDQSQKTIFLNGMEEGSNLPTRRNFDLTCSHNSDELQEGGFPFSYRNQTVSLWAVKQNGGVMVTRNKDIAKNLNQTVYNSPGRFKHIVKLKTNFRSPSPKMLYTDKLHEHKKTCLDGY